MRPGCGSQVIKILEDCPFGRSSANADIFFCRRGALKKTAGQGARPSWPPDPQVRQGGVALKESHSGVFFASCAQRFREVPQAAAAAIAFQVASGQ